MRIGVDARCLTGRVTGIGRYLRETLWKLDTLLPGTTWVLYSRSPVQLDWPSTRFCNVVDHHIFWRRLPGLLWVEARLGHLLAGDGLDVFWAIGTLAPRSAVPVVVTVHDLNHLVVPETMPIVNRLAYKRWFLADVHRASIVVANSRGTAARLLDLCGRSADHIAPPGGKWACMTDRGRYLPLFDNPYVLCVATKEPRKNLGSLIEAVEMLKRQGRLRDHLLVLVGASGWGKRNGRFGQQPSWLVDAGYVSDQKMAALFTAADVLVQPSEIGRAHV